MILLVFLAGAGVFGAGMLCGAAIVQNTAEKLLKSTTE